MKSKTETNNSDEMMTYRSQIMSIISENRISTECVARLAFAVPIAVMFALGQVAPAWATIDNTVTATGSSPGNSGDVTATALESVDVIDAAPALSVTKVVDDDTDVEVGQTVTYSYTVENSGNVTLTKVGLADNHEGVGTAPVPVFTATPLADNGAFGDSVDDGLDNVWDTLAPGDVVRFTSTYTVVQADLDSNGGGDGVLENTATATGTFGGADFTAEATESIDLEDLVATLAVTKDADETTDVALGQVITYTYTVTNTGNVAITAISLSESHNGSGPTPVPGGEKLLTDRGTFGDSSDGDADGTWDVLGPQDVVTFTATYTVTQSDIDTLQ